MILAIVGSTCLAGNPEARRVVERLVDDHLDDPFNLPLVICSGGARGVDSFAAEAAVERGARRVAASDLPGLEERPGDLWLLEFPPVCRQRGAPDGHRCTFKDCYAPRDRQIAEACTKLVRVAGQCTTSYGSGWTRDIAQRRGTPTEEVVVPMTDGEVVRLARAACKGVQAAGSLFPGQDALAAVRAALGRHRLLDEVSVAEDDGGVTIRRREAVLGRISIE